MTVAEKQRQLLEDLSIIEDRQERLAIVVDRARSVPALPAADRTDAHRVPGCVSAVWLHASLAEGRLRLRYDADSPMVKGLVGLVVEVYDGARPDDAATAEATLIEDLGLHRDLSPTRQNGLAAVRTRIKSLAGLLT